MREPTFSEHVRTTLFAAWHATSSERSIAWPSGSAFAPGARSGSAVASRMRPGNRSGHNESGQVSAGLPVAGND